MPIEGLTELQTFLRNMPENLRGKSFAIVKTTTEGAALDLKMAYPQRNYGSADKRGNLRKGVKTVYPSTSIATGIVKSTSPHAHLYEFGTQNRRTLTGANRGAMPPRPTAIPVFQRRRRSMNQALIEMVKAEGFEVSGGL